MEKFQAKMLRGSQKRENYLKLKIDRTHQENEKSESKMMQKQQNQSMELDMRVRVQEMLNEKKRERVQKQFNEQKESFDYFKEVKEQHQSRIAENKAK